MMASPENGATCISDEESDFGLLFDGLEEFQSSKGPSLNISADEVRQNFISEDLASELYDLLQCTHAIFEHFGIKYWLTGGSMIGYQRHGGIIPWDDDIDICILREDKEMVLSKEVISAFEKNNVHIVADFSFNIESTSLHKIYRSTVKSTAIKGGKVPYPFVDIFWMIEPNKHFDTIRFLSNGNDDHWISPGELYPLQTIKFGPVLAKAPGNPLPQLDRGYGEEWKKEGQLHTQDHVTKQGKGGPRRVFDVTPFLNVCAKWNPDKLTSKVILPDLIS